jgi:hypothetical protein
MNAVVVVMDESSSGGDERDTVNCGDGDECGGSGDDFGGDNERGEGVFIIDLIMLIESFRNLGKLPQFRDFG